MHDQAKIAFFFAYRQLCFHDELATTTMRNNQGCSNNYRGGCVIVWFLVRLHAQYRQSQHPFTESVLTPAKNSYLSCIPLSNSPRSFISSVILGSFFLLSSTYYFLSTIITSSPTPLTISHNYFYTPCIWHVKLYWPMLVRGIYFCNLIRKLFCAIIFCFSLQAVFANTENSYFHCRSRKLRLRLFSFINSNT